VISLGWTPVPLSFIKPQTSIVGNRIKPGRTILALLSLLSIAIGTAEAVAQSRLPRIDVAQAPAPLFDDPEWHGATDPFVIWNPSKRLWFMYYTQRRATMPNPNGVDWVHGSRIFGINKPVTETR